MKCTVLYDGWCGFCSSTIAFIKRFCSEDKVEFISFREIPDSESHILVTKERLEEKMHVIQKNGEIKNGASAFLSIAKTSPKLWPTVPILYFTIKIGIAEKVYDYIAKNRNIIPNNQCKSGSCKVDYKK